MKIIIVFFLTICSVVSFAQQIDTKKIDAFIDAIEKSNRDVGSLSVFKNSKEIYSRSFGQNRTDSPNVAKASRYQIGSVTKMITAILVFQLIEKGELALEDKLSAFFPAIPNAKRISIKNLLEHSSGLGDYTQKNDSVVWLKKHVEQTEIMQEIMGRAVLFEPGQKVSYSNTGYYLLARILEKKFNKPYYDIVRENISDKLKLPGISSYYEGIKDIYPSYEYAGRKWNKIEEFDFSNVIGLGDIVSTMTDLNILINDLFQYKIVKKESVEMMKPIWHKETFGRGLMLVPFYENSFFGHGGDTYGTHSIVAYNEKDSISVAYAINAERFPHNDFAIGLLSIIYGKEYELPEWKEAITVTSADLDKYLGIYSTSAFPLKITITKNGNELRGQGTGQPSFPLEGYEPNKFRYDGAQLRIEFVPDKNKLILYQGKVKAEMKRE